MWKSNCFKEFIKYSSTNVLGMIGLSCYILADTFFVSKGLGTNGLAALNLSVPIYSFINGIGLMIGMGAGTKYAIHINQGDNYTNKIFANAIYFASFFACIFIVIGIFFSDSVVTYLGADKNISSMTQTYVRVILLFSPAFLLNNVMLCFIRNDKAPQLSMSAMIGGSLSNVILDYIFIFPCKMGIFGAVFATGLAAIISILILLSHFTQKKNNFRFSPCKISEILLGDIFSSGVPSLITEMSSGIVILIFNAIILSLQGNVGVAGYGIVANISLVVIAIYTGIAQGIQPIISGNFGAGNSKNVHSILKYALTTMLIISSIIFASIFFGACFITAIFDSEQNKLLQTIAIQGLRLYFIACPFVGFNAIISVYFTSTGYALPAHIVSLIRGFVVTVPITFILSAVAGMIGVWCAFPATELIATITGIIFYYKNKKEKVSKYKKLVSRS